MRAPSPGGRRAPVRGGARSRPLGTRRRSAGRPASDSRRASRSRAASSSAQRDPNGRPKRRGAAVRLASMSLSVDRYELGPVGTNCYVVRLEPSATDAVVVDPGADVAELPQSCAGILITHSHWDHLGGVANYALRTGARVYMPRLEAPVLARPADWFPEIPLEPYDADVLLDGGESLELAGIEFETINVP